MFKWLRRYGAFGSALATTVRLLTSNWMLAVSIVFGFVTSWWAWITQWGYLPVVLFDIFAFGGAVWTLNGVVWFSTRNRPSKQKLTFDYSFGIALDDVIPSHDPENVHNNLEFRFQIRNVAPGPAKYDAERINVVIGDRIRSARNINGTLPRNSWIQLKVGGFDKDTVDQFPDRIAGTYEYTIIYGHPEDNYTRRGTKRIHFDLVKREGKVIAAPWNILEEHDSLV
jgi:hypothetical protein